MLGQEGYVEIQVMYRQGVSIKAISRELEFNRALSFLLDNLGSALNRAALANIADLNFHKIAASKLTVYRKIEER